MILEVQVIPSKVVPFKISVFLWTKSWRSESETKNEWIDLRPDGTRWAYMIFRAGNEKCPYIYIKKKGILILTWLPMAGPGGVAPSESICILSSIAGVLGGWDFGCEGGESNSEGAPWNGALLG